MLAARTPKYKKTKTENQKIKKPKEEAQEQET
jgi:hypothetical protein